jgi:hypothetical protein
MSLACTVFVDGRTSREWTASYQPSNRSSISFVLLDREASPYHIHLKIFGQNTTIVIMGIVFAIASATWLGVIGSHAVDSATNQLASDLWLAHTSATNRLTTALCITTEPVPLERCPGDHREMTGCTSLDLRAKAQSNGTPL